MRQYICLYDKSLWFSIVEPLCQIFEKCPETWIHPFAWKKTDFAPIQKKGRRQCKNNYKPISWKILEKLLFDKIYSHLYENLLSSFDSTINQLLSITHKIYNAFEEIPSKETRSVFLDLFLDLFLESGMRAYFTNY